MMVFRSMLRTTLRDFSNKYAKFVIDDQKVSQYLLQKQFLSFQIQKKLN